MNATIRFEASSQAFESHKPSWPSLSLIQASSCNQNRILSLSSFHFFFFISLASNLIQKDWEETILDLDPPYGRSLIDTKEIRGGVNMYIILHEGEGEAGAITRMKGIKFEK